MELDFQPEIAFKELSLLKAGALFMKIGAKKIIFALDLVKSKQNEIDFVVWIAPASFLAQEKYVSDIKKYAGPLCNKICCYSIESISISDNKYLQLYNLVDKYRTFCIVDESITIKNTEAGRTKRILSITPQIQIPSYSELYSPDTGIDRFIFSVEFLDSRILRMNESQFSNMFLPFYEDYYKTWRRWSRPEDEQLLVNLMKPYIFACDIQESYNLKYIDNDFELTEQEQKSYNDEKDNFLKNKTQVAFMEVVQNFQRMYTLSYNKIQAFLLLLKAIIDNNEKVIIYIKFLDEIIFFKSGFLSGFDFVECTGQSNKRRAISAFESNVNIMFCTYGVDQLDLDLSLCSNIIFFSQTFDYKSKIQILYNLYHTDFNKNVKVYNFWVRTGLEWIIRENLSHKANVLANVCRIIAKKEVRKL